MAFAEEAWGTESEHEYIPGLCEDNPLIWITKDHIEVLIHEMTPEHIDNAIRLLERKHVFDPLEYPQHAFLSFVKYLNEREGKNNE